MMTSVMESSNVTSLGGTVTSQLRYTRWGFPPVVAVLTGPDSKELHWPLFAARK